MSATFFLTAADFRTWLDQNHATATELHVGAYKKSSGLVGMTYPESVDQALCFGWIDGVVRKIDEHRFSHRFTPRKPGSIWSNVNVAHIARLTAAGLMHPAGLAAFAIRSAAKTGVYAFERKTEPVLPAAFVKKFRASPAAWKFFQAQPPGYRRLVLHHIVSAQQPATRERRLAQLIAASTAGRRLA
jgi:uncharacterized protein YdeI (YjbR/CyaY-like superfamily)